MIFRFNTKPIDLWRGCVFATIAHAIFVAHHPELANEQFWDGLNYNIQDSQGTIGTITFAKTGTVAAFFDSRSRRSPLSSEEEYDIAARLTEMPANLRTLAENESLQYLIQEYQGAYIPIITTVFWSDGGCLAAAEPWEEVFSNGGHLVRSQLYTINEATDIWRSHYALSTMQVKLLRSLFDQKLSAGEAPVVLSARDKDMLSDQGSEGLVQSRDILSGIAIIVP